MFSLVCLCLSTGGGGTYVTITHDTLELTVQGPFPFPPPGPTLPKRPLHTLNLTVQGLLTNAPTASAIWWPSL